MSDPKIIDPRTAAQSLRTGRDLSWTSWEDLALTVSTEPERTRAAVVKALREATSRLPSGYALFLWKRAYAIEQGADYA